MLVTEPLQSASPTGGVGVGTEVDVDGGVAEMAGTFVGVADGGGGVEQVRTFAEAALFNAGLAARQAVFDAVAKRAPTVNESELFTTFREMLREGPETGEAQSDAKAGGQAGAQATILVQVSPDEIIEVPREPRGDSRVG